MVGIRWLQRISTADVNISSLHPCTQQNCFIFHVLWADVQPSKSWSSAGVIKDESFHSTWIKATWSFCLAANKRIRYFIAHGYKWAGCFALTADGIKEGSARAPRTRAAALSLVALSSTSWLCNNIKQKEEKDGGRKYWATLLDKLLKDYQISLSNSAGAVPIYCCGEQRADPKGWFTFQPSPVVLNCG